MPLPPVFNLKSWIDQNRELLKPPVGNAQVWKDHEFIVMVIGGPNTRTDFHLDPGEEFFYQIQGDIILKVIEDGKLRDIPIREGEIFLLPPMVPHSPRRPAGTVGLVVERKRGAEEPDRLRWYCEHCLAITHEATFALHDITTQLKDLLNHVRADPSLRTCKQCGKATAP